MLWLLLFALWDAGWAQSTCCNMKQIFGSDINSGVYWLESGNDTRCGDGCLYSRENTADQYCFASSYTYVVNCSTVTKPVNVTAYWLNRLYITPTSLSSIGTYAAEQVCPTNSYVRGFSLMYAPLCGARCLSDDDVGLLGIRLSCQDLTSGTATGSITSGFLTNYTRVGGGTLVPPVWTSVQSCPTNKYFTATQYLSEIYVSTSVTTFSNFTCPQGVICSNVVVPNYDPIGGMNLNVQCSDSTKLNGATIPQSAKNSTSAWSDWVSCPGGYTVCGLQTRTYAGAGGDSTSNLGNTGVIFTCCQLPPGY